MVRRKVVGKAPRIAGYDYNPAGGAKTGKARAAKSRPVTPSQKARITKSVSKIKRRTK
jgi:hypothetical protein